MYNYIFKFNDETLLFSSSINEIYNAIIHFELRLLDTLSQKIKVYKEIVEDLNNGIIIIHKYDTLLNEYITSFEVDLVEIRFLCQDIINELLVDEINKIRN